MSTPGTPNPYAHGKLDTVHQDYSGRTLPGQTHLNNQWNAHQGFGMKNQGRNLMGDFGFGNSHSQGTVPSTPPRDGTLRQGGAPLKCGPKSVKRTGPRGKAYCARCNRNHVKTWDRFAKKYYCGFDPDAYSAQIKQSRKQTMGGKKTNRAKRSHKKTRRAHKKSKSRRKRR